MKGVVILSFVALCGCSPSAPEVQNTPTITKSEKSTIEEVSGISFSEYQRCLMERQCTLSEENEAGILSYGDNAFSTIIELDKITVNINGKTRNDKTPFEQDERNLSPQQNWLTSLTVAINDTDVVLPVSSFGDLSTPRNIYLRRNGRSNVILIFESSSMATLYQFKPIVCNSISLNEYTLVKRVSWYLPMAGQHYEKTNYNSPLCN